VKSWLSARDRSASRTGRKNLEEASEEGKEGTPIARDDIAKNRERFVKTLEQTASHRAIPIDRLDCREIPDKDGFQLIVESGGKERIFTIGDFESMKDPEGEIELIINQIIDNE
jgi:hypothetical protein